MTAATSHAGGRSRFAVAALALSAAAMLTAIAKLLASAALALGWPFELDYGEGIVWQQMLNMVAGRGYAPLGVFPAIVYHYPPVYHLLTAAAAAVTGADALVAGRLVSLVSGLASAALIGRLSVVAGGVTGRAALIGAGFAGLAFLGSPTVLFWSTLMRVDLLACALTLAGLCLTASSLAGRPRLGWAALAFALAVYTKQTAVLGPAAAFTVLWLARPRSAWTFLALSAGMGLAALAALTFATDGEFLRHVLIYNVNRFDPDRWRMVAAFVLTQLFPLALAALMVAAAWRRLRPSAWRELRARLAAEPADAALLLALAYLALRIATLPLILKSGSNFNYLIDLYAAACVFVGLGVRRVADAVVGGGPWPRPLVVALVLAGLPAHGLTSGVANGSALHPALLADRQELVERIRAADKPVIADSMALIIRAGKPVLFESAITAELSHAGLYDQPALIRMVERRAFAFFVFDGGPGTPAFAGRYSPALAAAIARAYPRTKIYGDLVVALPPAERGEIEVPPTF